MKNTEHEDIITYILIGIGIGVGIGFVLKVFLDTYIIIESLPLWTKIKNPYGILMTRFSNTLKFSYTSLYSVFTSVFWHKFFNLPLFRYTYIKGFYMDIKKSNIDTILVDLIIDHFNVQSMEGRRESLTSVDFDELVDVAESIYFKKVAITEKPALA